MGTTDGTLLGSILCVPSVNRFVIDNMTFFRYMYKKKIVMPYRLQLSFHHKENFV